MTKNVTVWGAWWLAAEITRCCRINRHVYLYILARQKTHPYNDTNKQQTHQHTDRSIQTRSGPGIPSRFDNDYGESFVTSRAQRAVSPRQARSQRKANARTYFTRFCAMLVPFFAAHSHGALLHCVTAERQAKLHGMALASRTKPHRDEWNITLYKCACQTHK